MCLGMTVRRKARYLHLLLKRVELAEDILFLEARQTFFQLARTTGPQRLAGTGEFLAVDLEVRLAEDFDGGVDVGFGHGPGFQQAARLKNAEVAAASPPPVAAPGANGAPP